MLRGGREAAAGNWICNIYMLGYCHLFWGEGIVKGGRSDLGCLPRPIHKKKEGGLLSLRMSAMKFCCDTFGRLEMGGVGTFELDFEHSFSSFLSSSSRSRLLTAYDSVGFTHSTSPLSKIRILHWALYHSEMLMLLKYSGFPPKNYLCYY